METHPDQQTLTPPRVSYLKNTDFDSNGLFVARITAFVTVASKKFNGAYDTELELETATGIKRRFSLWGDNHTFLYDTTKGAVVGKTVNIRITQTEVAGKIVTRKTIEACV